MKKMMIKPLTYVMLATLTITQSGCFGSFSLVKKVWQFNDSAVDNKFVKTVLFYALNIVPVYGIAATIDVVILNLVEFWTGSNPVAMNEGDVEYDIIEKNGVAYEFMVTKNKYHITVLNGKEEGKVVEVYFDTANLSWNYKNDNDVAILAQLVNQDDMTFVKVNTVDGDLLVEADEYAMEAKLKEEKIDLAVK